MAVPRAALVAYASTHGHTHRVADRLADGLAEAGVHPRVCAVEDAASVDPAAFELVIVGASVHSGRHQDEVKAWLAANRDALAGRHTVFFSVSLTAAEDSDEARGTVRGTIDALLEETGFAPAIVEPVAGALQYREYDVATRVLIRLIARRMGLPTDTSIDHDYTDWGAVDALATRSAALLGDVPRERVDRA